MHIDELYGRINTALNWNAFSFTIFKLTSTALTFVLFKKLSTDQFALWTGIQSLTYLILIWADCGIRKTIPAFFPQLADASRKQFIYKLIGVYISILTIACPLALWLIARYTTQVQLPMNNWLLVASAVLFFGHGLETLFQGFFHAYLWHRTYNALLTVIQTTYMLLVILAAFTMPASINMVLFITLGKGVASLMCAISSGILMTQWLPIQNSEYAPVSRSFIQKFTKHAGLMWITSFLKTFTERNVTVPFVTYCLGPVLGNMFKVAQDAALLLQRLVFRTIGTTDTLLFAYLKNSHTAKENLLVFQHAFTKLVTKLAYLALPLLGIVWFLFYQIHAGGATNYGFQLFFIIALALLIELLLLPYKRILEVHGDYTHLAYAYTIYVVLIGIVFTLLAYGYIGLLLFIVGIFIVRIVSMATMGYFVYHIYKIVYPYKQITFMMILFLFLGYLLHVLTHYFFGTDLITFYGLLLPLSTKLS